MQLCSQTLGLEQVPSRSLPISTDHFLSINRLRVSLYITYVDISSKMGLRKYLALVFITIFLAVAPPVVSLPRYIHHTIPSSSNVSL